MQIHISPQDGVPIYLQIVNQVKYLVASGRLAPGEELPPIRVLGGAAGDQPEHSGPGVSGAGGEPAWSASGGRPAPTCRMPAHRCARRERLKILTERIDALLAEARQMGVGHRQGRRP